MTEHEEASKPKETGKGKKTTPVVNYIGLLFGAAFVLLLLTYMMEQRQSAEALDGLRNSVSAMQSVEGLYDQIGELQEEKNNLEQALYQQELALEKEKTKVEDLEEELQFSQGAHVALDWFWQVNEAFVLGREDLTIQLIVTMEEEALSGLLPPTSATDNHRFSPAHRYAEIQRELGMDQEWWTAYEESATQEG